MYTKSHGSIEQEAAHSIVQVILGVGMNLNKMAGSQKEREGSYRGAQFEQKYVCNKKGSSPG